MKYTTDIPGLEGLYSITEYGDIWSYPNGNHEGKYRIAQKNRKTGYLKMVFQKNKKPITNTIHRLVALTYIPNPHNYPCVRHLDNNKLNNHVSNLEWCTYKTNAQQMHDDGLHPVTEIMRESCRKKGLAQRKKIMQLTREGILCKVYNSINLASRITGISQGSISNVAIGRTGTAGGYYWKYLI